MNVFGRCYGNSYLVHLLALLVYIKDIGKESTDIRTGIQNGKVWCGLVGVPTC